MDKSKLAKELKTTVEDINYLILESGLDDNPESTTFISEDDAAKIRAIANPTKQAIGNVANPADKSQALARVPIAEIATKTGISEANITGMIDVIWQLELAAIAEEERKLEEYRHAVKLASKTDILQRELTAKINHLNKIAGFNPYDILGVDPDNKRDELATLTADALTLANAILAKGK